jgi:hypothetical protein
LKQELGDVKKTTQFIEDKNAFQLDKQSEIYLDKLNNESRILLSRTRNLRAIDFLINYLNKNFTSVPLELGTQEATLLPLITQYNQLQVERQNAVATMPETNPYIQQKPGTLA